MSNIMGELASEKVTIRLTPDQVKRIDYLVDQGKFNDRSKAIVTAITETLLGDEMSPFDYLRFHVQKLLQSGVPPENINKTIEAYVTYYEQERKQKYQNGK